MRIVLDTNVYIAAALSNSGFSEEVLKLAVSANFKIIICEEILQEIQNKLTHKFHLPKENIDFFLARVRRITETVEIEGEISVITRDPGDNKILECAAVGEADLIVSLDQDLIKLKKFQGIGIVHPKTLSWTFPEYFKK